MSFNYDLDRMKELVKGPFITLGELRQMANMSEVEKLQLWFETEKKRGVIDVKITVRGKRLSIVDITDEEIAKEVNQVNEAINAGRITRTDVF